MVAIETEAAVSFPLSHSSLYSFFSLSVSLFLSLSLSLYIYIYTHIHIIGNPIPVLQFITG